MKNLERFYILILFLFPAAFYAQAQESWLYFDTEKDSTTYSHHSKFPFRKEVVEITETDLKKALDQQPAFAVFKDAFFVTGIPLHEPINNKTADAMFQFSIRQRLTKSYLPFNFFGYLTFSQKAFWDIYSESSPFRDINFTPGIGVGKY
ncbi:MAG: phospholipase A, partial [Tannerellaceae bacterium]|nr:phospholipase A [Tannerellaceae bacterium]